MKLVFLTLCWGLALAPSLSRSQTTDWKGQETTGPAESVLILGTKPTITGDKTFRIVFRLSSMIDEEVSYAVLFDGYYLHGWEAIPSNLQACTVDRRTGIRNTPLISGKSENASRLEKYDGSEASMGRNRPVYVLVDFNCENPIFEGEEITIQTAFYYRINLEWKKANYLFDKRVLAK